MAGIHFFSEDVEFTPKTPRKLKSWIITSAGKEKASINEVNYIFCSDKYLLRLNKEYLNHNTYTDIITFDNSQSKGEIEGDIFISVDRVKENAEKFNVTFDMELHRVMIHGVLHLIGYKDKSLADKSKMRKKEDACLSLWK